MKNFNSIRIDIEPWYFTSTDVSGRKELRISVQVDRKNVVTTTQIISESDFESRFDFTFDRAKAMLVEELKKLEDK